MSVTFQANIAPSFSLVGGICSICHNGFREGSKTASHIEKTETIDHRVSTVFHTSHFECVRASLCNENPLCPDCGKKIVSLKEKVMPKAMAIANGIIVISSLVMFGGVLLAELLGVTSGDGLAPKIGVTCLGAVGMGASAVIAKVVIERLEGTTRPTSSEDKYDYNDFNDS